MNELFKLLHSIDDGLKSVADNIDWAGICGFIGLSLVWLDILPSFEILASALKMSTIVLKFIASAGGCLLVYYSLRIKLKQFKREQSSMTKNKRPL